MSERGYRWNRERGKPIEDFLRRMYPDKGKSVPEIVLEPPINPRDYDQIIGRVYRKGQEGDVGNDSG